MDNSHLHNFFLPSLTRKFLIRVTLVAIVTYLIFSYLLIPLRIQGQSMEPTYRDGGFAFCWRPMYFLSSPKRFDIVAVRYAGRRVMLLKRIIGLPGETVEFRRGDLYINGRRILLNPMSNTIQPGILGQDVLPRVKSILLVIIVEHL